KSPVLRPDIRIGSPVPHIKVLLLPRRKSSGQEESMGSSAPNGRHGSFGLYPHLAECLDDVANFQGVVVFENEAALVALRHFAHIILAAPNRLDQPGEDRLAAALDA